VCIYRRRRRDERKMKMKMYKKKRKFCYKRRRKKGLGLLVSRLEEVSSDQTERKIKGNYKMRKRKRRP